MNRPILLKASRVLSLLPAIAVLFSAFIVAPISSAQSTRAINGDAAQDGSITGSLVPAANAKFPLTSVTVSIEETGDKALVDRHGQFTFMSVKPGTYTLVATGAGFSRLRITDVVVQPNREVTLGVETMPVIMKDGELQVMEEVVVTAKKEVQTMNPYLVQDVKPEPFSDRNVDLPRGIDDVQPYYIFDSQTIEESGTTDVEDFLKQRLTMDTTAQTQSQITMYQTGASAYTTPSTASSINLNGLGTDHTLILVNGLPRAGVALFTGNAIAQPGQPDVNGIPLAAIDRIEVLPSSAGAIYGAGAEGGVINIILKKAYSGGDITATYASTWDGHGPSHALEATFGHSFENGKTQLFFTAQYSDASPMFVGDRVNLLNRGYATLLKNDPKYLSFNPQEVQYGEFPLGGTPNFANADGAGDLTFKSNGASFGSNFGTLPSGYSASSSPSSLIPGKFNLSPGEDNEGPNGLLVPLGNYPRRKSIMATLTRQMTSKLELHLDYSYNGNYSYSNYNPVQTSAGYQAYVPVNAPENPFNQDVYVSFPTNFNAPATSYTVSDSVTFGGTLKLPFDWIAHMDYQWSQSAYESYSLGGTNTYQAFEMQSATFSGIYNGVPYSFPTPVFSGVINPFTDTLANPINWAPYSGDYYQTGKTTANDLVFAATGPLFHLPWGDPRLSIRLEHNKSGQPQGSIFAIEPIGIQYPGLDQPASVETAFGQTQTIDSANAELDLPIFKSRWPFLKSLDLQINFSNETSTVWTGTPGIIYQAPDQYDYFYNGYTGLLAPNSLSSNSTEFLTATSLAGGGVIPASGARPYRVRAVSSNTGVTGPALSYRPTDDLIFRFSAASGYVPPTYTQLLPTAASALMPTTLMINDPRSGTSYNVAGYSLGGNSNLKPETSKSWDFGGIWEPKTGLLKGFRFDAEFTETSQQNQITDPGVQGIVNFEAYFPNNVIRDSAGQIITVYDQFINVAEAKQESWNLTADYHWRTAIGSFDLSGAESIQEHNKQQIVANTQFLEYVGYPNSGGVAKTKANLRLRWAYKNCAAAWTMVYFDGYKQVDAPGDPAAYGSYLELNQPYTINTSVYSDITAQGGYTIPSQTYHNLYLSYSIPKDPFERTSRVGSWTDNVLNGTKISVSVNNVFNTLPPFDAYYHPFYASPYGDLQLRNYSISIRKSF